MAVLPFDSAVYGPLFTDGDVAAVFSDASELDALIEVERALARAQARLGVIPEAAGAEIDRALAGAEIDPASLADGARSAGVVVPGLVKQLRKIAGGEAAQYVHWGATSQDIADTALVIRLERATGLLGARLDKVIARLADLADRHRATVMAARTRTQIAVPTTFGLKAATWLAPLLRRRAQLHELQGRLLVVQFGGAGGNLSALGADGVRVMEALAVELGLKAGPLPWHTGRDGLMELAAWLASLTASLGKIGTDVALLARNEIVELRPGSGGGSSTMPQKANPVSAELLVALARYTAGTLGTFAQSGIHAEERDGAAWSLEWATLPSMVTATAGALAHAEALLAGLVVEQAAMADRAGGGALAEAASFALAEHMSREQAQDLVKKAAMSGGDLVEALRGLCDAPIDWKALGDPRQHLGAADAFVDRVLAEVRAR
ncbi:3-carboxy-cis,cis-muconate cycloisomerase [Amorphus orientalis]|uniref:3-carboxy-cis,cis-muconate cycloisomerase n=1 Tax=Amorphus orientalis TaxID=649198 RepID=A0AAE3VL16_9HYPH|nr:3-carboxy-cis,cis-muconate cycloisomerase [Amorphus orientalis]MDQ0313863.1 3-carboxy-cis,cis-muconate cycloisomerase [Amorphus orientalis]